MQSCRVEWDPCRPSSRNTLACGIPILFADLMTLDRQEGMVKMNFAREERRRYASSSAPWAGDAPATMPPDENQQTLHAWWRRQMKGGWQPARTIAIIATGYCIEFGPRMMTVSPGLRPCFCTNAVDAKVEQAFTSWWPIRTPVVASLKPPVILGCCAVWCLKSKSQSQIATSVGTAFLSV